MCGHLDLHEAVGIVVSSALCPSDFVIDSNDSMVQVLRRGGSELDSRLQAALDIVSGMTYLHGLHYIHRDLATYVQCDLSLCSSHFYYYFCPKRLIKSPLATRKLKSHHI